MAVYQSYTAFSDALGALASDLPKSITKQVTLAMGDEAQKIASRAASADLGGDRAHSGWGVPLDTQLISKKDVTIMAPTRYSAGPWTVAERGRNQGETGRLLGPGISQKYGTTLRNKNGEVRKVRKSKAKRWNGTTTGKNTATDAVVVMNNVLPKIADRLIAVEFAKRFGKG
jgi:hypothetical protein